MQTKKWYQSKTIWGIVLALLISLAQIFGVTPQELPAELLKFVQVVSLVYGIVGRVTASTVIK